MSPAAAMNSFYPDVKIYFLQEVFPILINLASFDRLVCMPLILVESLICLMSWVSFCLIMGSRRFTTSSFDNHSLWLHIHAFPEIGVLEYHYCNVKILLIACFIGLREDDMQDFIDA
ncbi:hypothetical protein PanWU01x14_248480 [Parasponia andersonii]|uniref:Uncharacterized protein n=1 Tax=Parasponia andersonii TaxID=3476 RepID=A0A2P5BDJ7_PARAD|nr:hypothetical protein PanWU01x14_248480 [Parasponia andersonii]